MSDACVKVGVRIRPLNSKERHQNSVLTDFDKESVLFKGQSFTLDYVFGPELDQVQMYQSTAAPMLKSFLEGYNVTIMAYGQTGSGKTHTMGTADTRIGGEADEETQGLLPRFVSDLFENLKDLADHEHVQSKIKVSFLEIYGEDVHDLITESTGRIERPSLPVRENDQGQVFVQGLQEQDVTTADQALEVLYEGTHHRTTAATNMNAGSSRSHAVFTITLDQKVVSPDGDDDGGREMTSKLTFVDLAGSERLKRTGAEGQRMKEGIQINSGLFNLGQVINGLADDKRLKNGTKAVHIPYRNSKLTHLLKDALGGNSKTLFLACVSPAEINESETYSTLMYARQARNIQNKPIQNMDKTQMQIRRLKCTAKTWMIKALTLMYGNNPGANIAGRPPLPGSVCTSPLPSGAGLGHLSPAGRASTGQYISLGSHTKGGDSSGVTELLQRTDVQEYIKSVEEAISASLNQTTAQSPRKVRLSILSSSPAAMSRAPILKSANKKDNTNSAQLGHPKKLFSDHDEKPVGRSERRMSMLDSAPLPVMDEAESEKLVARMLEIVNKEKTSASQSTAGGASETESDGSPKIDEKRVDQEIEEKEEILVKLMDTVKGYSALKADYERLMDEIGNLDAERRDLEISLQKAQSSKQNTGTGVKSAAVEKLQERFKKVNEELQKMRSDRSRKETAYRMMQREAKQCEQLSKELYALKSVKVQLQKKQKEQAQLHLKFKKEQQCKIHQLKKSDVKKQQAMNDLKNELTKKQRVLGHKDRELSRMQSKLKACEEHITQLLRIQTAGRGGNSSTRSVPTKTPSKAATSSSHSEDTSSRGSFAQSLSALEFDHYVSSKNVLDNLVADRVEKKELAASYELKSNIIKELNDEVLLEKSELKDLQCQLDELEREHAELLNAGNTEEAEDVAVSIMHLEQNIQGIQADLDSVTREISMHSLDLKEISSKMARFAPSSSKNDSTKSDGSWDDLGKNVISGLSQTQSQATIWELLEEKAESVARATELQEKLKQTVDVTNYQQDTVVHYEKQIQTLKEELRTKLQEAEKKRVNDVWALMKAQSSHDDDNDSPSGRRDKSSLTMATDIAAEVSRSRAQELENALEEYLSNEEAKRIELEEYKSTVSSLEIELMELRMQQQQSGSGGGGYYDGLKSLWEKLGTHSTQRAELLDRIEKARNQAKEQVLAEYQDQILSAKEEELRLVGEIEQLRHILGSTGDENNAEDRSKSASLLGRIHTLHTARTKFLDALEVRSRQVQDIQGRLMTLMRQMELDSDDTKITSGGLNELLEIPPFPFDEEQRDRDDDVGEELVEIYINKLSSLETVFDDGIINNWIERVQSLSIERGKNIARSTAARNEASATAQLLGFHGADELADSVDLGEVSELPAITIETAFESLFDEHFHPQGSLALVEVLEQINLVLKTMDINRRGVMKPMHTLASRWNTVISFNGDELSIPLGVADVSPSAEIVTDLFQSILTRWNQCHTDIENFQSLTCSISSGLAMSTEDQSTRQALLAAMLSRECDLSASSFDEASIRQYSDADNIYEIISELSDTFKCFRSCIDDLEEILMFIDEVWVKEFIKQLISAWSTHRTDITKMMILQAELNRIQSLDTSVKEVKRLDILLGKHIKEMEDFEATSKQNRNKVLSGSSKALIEEEKFRKTGKRKYEHIVDKLVVAFSQVQYRMPAAKSDLLSSPILNLSQTSIAAVKAKGKSTERTDLMHLHTTTHGTKRWSGDLVDAELAGHSNEAASHPVANTPTSKGSWKQSAAPLGSPVLKPSTKTPAVKHSNVVPEGNVFANCLAASSKPSKDENTNYINASK